MSKFEDDIKTLINVLSESIESETLEKNRETIDKLRELSKDKMFFNKIEYAQHQFSRVVAGVIGVPKQKNMYIVEHIVSGLYEHFHRTLIEKTEGSGCCADKSRFIKNMTLKALKENTNLSLYEDYTKCDQIKEDKEQQAYWSPKTITDTDTAMKMFWDWYLLRVN